MIVKTTGLQSYCAPYRAPTPHPARSGASKTLKIRGNTGGGGWTRTNDLRIMRFPYPVPITKITLFFWVHEPVPGALCLASAA